MKSTSIAPKQAEPRGARRKRETRRRLLRAALTLMSQRGMDSVAINEITEAADVGFGSFYNHFESKEAVYAALVNEVFENFGAALAQLSDSLDDPAEVIAASIRYTLKQAQEDPEWGNFLLKAGFSAQILSRGLGRHLLRDLQSGYAQGRFRDNDPLAALLVISGAVLATIATEFNLAAPDGTGLANARELGLATDNLAQRVTSALLRQLGLTDSEAAEIATRPLPPVELPPAGL